MSNSKRPTPHQDGLGELAVNEILLILAFRQISAQGRADVLRIAQALAARNL